MPCKSVSKHCAIMFGFRGRKSLFKCTYFYSVILAERLRDTTSPLFVMHIEIVLES